MTASALKMAILHRARIISGPATNLLTPTDVSLDKVKNLLYVADDVDIHVFASASTVNGNPAPLHDLTVPFAVSAIFIDGANDRLYVADQSGNVIAIYDHASTLNGAIAANSRHPGREYESVESGRSPGRWSGASGGE